MSVERKKVCQTSAYLLQIRVYVWINTRRKSSETQFLKILEDNEHFPSLKFCWKQAM